MEHTLSNGQKIKVVVGRICGVSTDEGITISDQVTDLDELESYIHELLHQEFETLPETEVRKKAISVAQLLWKVGYRLPKSKGKGKRRSSRRPGQ
jgi:hypothetical protein